MSRLLTLNLMISLVAVFISTSAMATNGMNMIGANTRSTGVGGADVALDGDCPGCNPATLGGDGSRYFSAGMAILHAPVGFKNLAFGPNNADTDDDVYYAPYLEYAQRFGQYSPWTIGVTIRAQGGMGVDFKDVVTIVGYSDDLYTNLQVGRIMPTISYQMNPNLSVGASLVMGRVQMDSKLFPNTYSPGMDGTQGTQDDFIGMEIDGVKDEAFSGRLGLHYKVNDRLSLGFSYTAESKFDLDDGNLMLNMGSKVIYDSYIDDFTWPQEAEAGLTFMVLPKLLITTDVHWINWSSAFDELIVRGSNPNIPSPIQNPELRFKMKWDDQWVFALGAEYHYSPQHIFRIGYNYGKSPIPDAYVVPLFPGIVEHHITFGYAYVMQRFRMDLALERSFSNTQHNNNPNPVENPFGPDSQVDANSGTVLHFSVSYQY